MNLFNRFISFSIKNKLIIGAFTIGLIAWGIFSASRLPIDAVPDITNNQVQVITVTPTLSAQEVELFVTAPVEFTLTTIPDMIELRSVSRLGLSVITIVFKEKVDIYKARQLVGERLKEAETQIPEGFGRPELAPVTTGLGEIYQYILHTKKGYENKYSPIELRTMEDWIVKRQLLGTVGVAEVSSFGGYLKEYEIAVNPDQLRSMNVSLTEIFDALAKNNQNTGGAYIEKKPNAYFIRGIGLVTSLKDIEEIVIRTNAANTPLLIRDVARVQYGSAVRYGAMTRNNEGETVGALVLMLKGANSAEVIENVKERIKQVEKTLPEGVEIEPFIDRTKLVNKAIGTIKTNLLEGALIVVFVLVLLLGNLRAGLVVASVIPLAMLFAISMMNVFGVSGNLMSLGAIDFGLIVDGAVIIVEATMHHLHSRKNKQKFTQAEMDKEVNESAGKIMSSASFGQIIILIVYLPILSLVGIEGKMFRPMAQTVAFAVLGAFILSLTYVPVISALFLSKKTEHKRNISDRIMHGIKRIYLPSLNAALRFKKTIVALSLVLLVITWFIFSKMGGEFIPTLEEGDFAVETTLMADASLSQTIETFQQAAGILKEKFPEVIEVVGKIGSSEIPTDPMPVNNGDLMIILKDKKEWTSADNREALAEKMSQALSIIPGVEFGFQQPIQMRFNELMTGTRQDVAIKIFGENLEILAENANKVSKLIENIQGVEDIYVEKVTGLPQVQVKYKRDKIAQYGLTILDVNRVLKTAFAGEVAGVVFEGEKRFDLVVRLDTNYRRTIGDVKDLNVPLPSGNQIPIEELADVQFKSGSMQISREDAKRRIYVGFNVRGRDVQSVVEEIQQKLDNSLKLPPGYYTTYGGQFQNLKEAKQRLSIAVPVALLLILVLLYFTFNSIKESLFIFTAVPLAAVGGVFALLIRGMPFSISAGIGFIALFGVAVLNGIVLISQFNYLQKEGVADIYERVRRGTLVRLRPVIITAAVASLGFLPMALSTSAGAEVQKPLATVVIGGLITATILTLIVLPVLYILFSGEGKSKFRQMKSLIIILCVATSFLIPCNRSVAQNRPLTLENALNIARQNNLQLKASEINIKQSTTLQRTAFDPPKTDILLQQDVADGGSSGNSIGIIQQFSLPPVYRNQANLLKQQTVLAQKEKDLTAAEVTRLVKTAYYNFLFNYEKLRILFSLDSIYRKFKERAELRQQVGETSNLEKYSSLSRYGEIQLKIRQTKYDLQTSEAVLQKLLNTSEPLQPADTVFTKVAPSFMLDTSLANHPQMNVFNQQLNVANAQLKVERSKTLPDLTVGYYHQFLVKGFDPAKIGRSYTPNTRTGGFELGVAIPLFYGAHAARIKAAKINTELIRAQTAGTKNQLQTQYLQQYNEYLKQKDALDYYETIGVQQANEILRISQVSYNLGEIGYVEYIQNLTEAFNIRINYLEALNLYNQAIMELNYLQGGK
jgi:cobalt-zinc-cadmium resistance protein CzcA